MHAAVDAGLNTGERPSDLPTDILWFKRDCNEDKLGARPTSKNRSRPKMKMAIRTREGKVVPTEFYTGIKDTGRKIVVNMLEKARVAMGGSLPEKGFKKADFERRFPEQWEAALTEFETKIPLLALCAFHWKADQILVNILQNRNRKSKLKGKSTGSSSRKRRRSKQDSDSDEGKDDDTEDDTEDDSEDRSEVGAPTRRKRGRSGTATAQTNLTKKVKRSAGDGKLDDVDHEHQMDTTSGKSILSKETPGITQESLGTPRMLRTARTHREPQDKINNFRIAQDILRITQDSLRIYSG